MADFPYPMWVIVCKSATCRDGHGVMTVWENVGTRVPYVEHCPACGSEHYVETVKVENKEEHEEVFENGIPAA